MLSDYHMHFEYGEYDEEWVKLFFEQAEKMGLKEIGITEHSHGFVEFKDMYYDELILDDSEIGKFQQKWLDNPKSRKSKTNYWEVWFWLYNCVNSFY